MLNQAHVVSNTLSNMHEYWLLQRSVRFMFVLMNGFGELRNLLGSCGAHECALCVCSTHFQIHKTRCIGVEIATPTIQSTFCVVCVSDLVSIYVFLLLLLRPN
jgi:hypothetical protein